MTASSVGIPRSILHYEFGGRLASFLECLDVSVVLSPKTDRRIFQAGKRWMLDEICLPVKAFAGHVAWLVEHDVDTVLIPVVVGHKNGRVYPCHLRTRLADVVCALGLCPRERLLTPTFHFDDDGLSDDGLYELGSALGIGADALSHVLDKCVDVSPASTPELTLDANAPVVAVLGHPYVVQDPWLNGNVVNKLCSLGCRIHLEPHDCGSIGYSPTGTGLHFDLAARTLTSARQWDTDKSVDGMIFLLPFNCGPDGDIARHMAQTTCTPMMTLVLDELQSDGGMLTRLEAFVDLLSHRKPIGSVIR